MAIGGILQAAARVAQAGAKAGGAAAKAGAKAGGKAAGKASKKAGKKVKSVGNKWSDFQIKNYKSNTQPYYVIIDHSEKQMIESASYDPDVEKFVDWLDRGVSEFNKTK